MGVPGVRTSPLFFLFFSRGGGGGGRGGGVDFFYFDSFFIYFFYPGLVQLLISWSSTQVHIDAPSVQGAIPMSIFRFSYQVAVVGFEPPIF